MNLNKLHNASNPYQGGAKKVLCLCSAGLLRSPTTAIVLHREYGFNTRAAGINPDYALIDASEILMHWADEIVVMEEYMISSIPEFFHDKKTILCLNIPDKYAYMDPELQQMIKEKYDASS